MAGIDQRIYLFRAVLEAGERSLSFRAEPGGGISGISVGETAGGIQTGRTLAGEKIPGN